jgi:multidrug efflux pump
LSSIGVPGIILQFDLNRDIDGATQDRQQSTPNNLPSNMPSRPIYRKVNPADSPIMILPTSETMTREQLYDAARLFLRKNFKFKELGDRRRQFAAGGTD